MATFPAFRPSERTYTPGDYPNSPFRALSGAESRVRHSSVQVASQLRLRFLDITEAEMLQIINHYKGQAGGWQPFALPELIWSAADNPNDFLLPGYAWRYLEKPTVEDIFCSGHNVEVVLETVAGEGVGLLGVSVTALTTFAPGKAAASNGVDFIATTAFITNQTLVAGTDYSATGTFTAGTAANTFAGNAPGAYYYASGAFNATPAIGNLGRIYTASAAFSPGIGYSSLDPYYDDVLLLIQGITNISDASSYARSLTVTNAAISTNQARFGPSSISFNGSNSRIDFTSLRADAPYCFDAWFYLNSTSVGQQICYGFNETGILINCDQYGNTGDPASAGNIKVGGGGVNSYGHFVTNTGITAGRWYHLRFSNDGTTERLFLDGVIISSVTRFDVPSGYFRIDQIGHAGNDNHFDGYMSGIRLTDDNARSTTGFAVPLESWPDATAIRYAAPLGITPSATGTLVAGTATGS